MPPFLVDAEIYEQIYQGLTQSKKKELLKATKVLDKIH